MKIWIERQRGLIDYSVANLGRRRGRNLGLFVAYSMVVFLLASVVLYGDALRSEARLLLADAPELVVQKLIAGRHDLMPETWLESVRAIRGVQKVEGRLWGYYYDPTIAANYTMQTSADPLLKPGQAMIGAALARARGLNVGDVLSLRSAEGQPYAFSLVGVLDADSELVSADLMLVHADDFRGFFGVEADLYTDIALSVRNPNEVRKVAEKVLERLPGARVIAREEMQRTYAAAFNWRQGVLLTFLSTLMAAFALLAWDKASGLSAEERREIGILKALGWETGDVLRMKMWEGAVVSLSAFLTGYVLAWLHVFYADAPLFTAVLKGWSVLYPRFALTPQIDVAQITALFFLTVLPFVVATVVPVWRASTLDPDEVMRE
jgi:ABC-type lipoprotein release transport system permease subunit